MEMNEKEKKVLAKFPKSGEPVTISELAKAAFPSMGVASKTRGNSWVRNSIRRPIKAKMVKQLGRGLYVLTSPSTTPSKKRTTRPARKISAKSKPSKAMNGSATKTENSVAIEAQA